MVYCGNSCAAEVHVASGSLRNGIFRLGLIDIPQRQCNEIFGRAHSTELERTPRSLYRSAKS